MAAIFGMVSAVVIIRMVISFVYTQLTRNTRYALPFAFQAFVYWVLKYARDGANYEAATRIPIAGTFIRLFVGYVDRAIHWSLGAGGAVGTACYIMVSSVLGSEGLEGLLQTLFSFVPCAAVTVLVGYLVIFPLSYLGMIGDLRRS